MKVSKLVFRAGWPLPKVADGSGVELRMAVPELDVEPIACVAEACHGDAFPALATAGVLAELVSRPGRRVSVWLACIEGRPVGMAAVVAAGTVAPLRHSISWLLVSSHARRRGVGTSLVSAAVSDAIRRGAAEVWAETRTTWPEAMAFWPACGFRPAS